jgi:hypothetical protein
MIYFRSKVVYQDEELLAFVVPKDLLDEKVEFSSIMFDRTDDVELHGLKISQDLVKEVLSRQHKECEVEQVDFIEIEKQLAGCRFSREIDAYVKDNIDTRCSQKEQMRIESLKTTSKERIELTALVDTYNKQGDEIRTNLGLKIS